jgi:hypothetical protein
LRGLADRDGPLLGRRASRSEVLSGDAGSLRSGLGRRSHRDERLSPDAGRGLAPLQLVAGEYEGLPASAGGACRAWLPALTARNRRSAVPERDCRDCAVVEVPAKCSAPNPADVSAGCSVAPARRNRSRPAATAACDRCAVTTTPTNRRSPAARAVGDCC